MKKRRSMDTLENRFQCDELMREIYRIRDIRKSRGIEVNPNKYLPGFTPPKQWRPDGELVAKIVKQKEPSENEQKIDKAFKFYYESGCTAKL